MFTLNRNCDTAAHQRKTFVILCGANVHLRGLNG